MIALGIAITPYGGGGQDIDAAGDIGVYCLGKSGRGLFFFGEAGCCQILGLDALSLMNRLALGGFNNRNVLTAEPQIYEPVSRGHFLGFGNFHLLPPVRLDCVVK